MVCCSIRSSSAAVRHMRCQHLNPRVMFLIIGNITRGLRCLKYRNSATQKMILCVAEFLYFIGAQSLVSVISSREDG